MISPIRIVKITEQKDLETVFAIRRTVFVDEQNCPPELEWEYEDESTHFLALYNDQPAGAARWRKTEKGYKLERFAVLKEFRGKKVGDALVKAVIADLPKTEELIYLNGQVQTVPFYERLGFETSGAEFLEAGIRHYKMVLK